MKMNRVSKSYHLLFKQIACESPRMFCSDSPTALPPDPYGYGADLALTASTASSKVDFLSRDTCWYFQNMEILPVAVSALEVLHQIVLLLHFFWTPFSPGLVQSEQYRKASVHTSPFPSTALSPREKSINLVGSQWDFIWQLLRYSLKLTKSSHWPQHTDFFILQCDKVLQATLPDSLCVISILFFFKDPGKTEVLPTISESGIPCNLLHSLQSTDNTQLQTFEHHPDFTSFNQLHANIFRCPNTLCRLGRSQDLQHLPQACAGGSPGQRA